MALLTESYQQPSLLITQLSHILLNSSIKVISVNKLPSLQGEVVVGSVPLQQEGPGSIPQLDPLCVQCALQLHPTIPKICLIG